MQQGASGKRKLKAEEPRPVIYRRDKTAIDEMLSCYENTVIENNGDCPHCGKEIMSLNTQAEYKFNVTRGTVITHADQKCARHKRAAPVDRSIRISNKEDVEEEESEGKQHHQLQANNDGGGDKRNVKVIFEPSAETNHQTSPRKRPKAPDEFTIHESAILEFQGDLTDCCYSKPWYDIAGTQYEGRAFRLDACDDGELVILQKEPDNPHDIYAVRLYPFELYPESSADLGFIPRDQNYEFITSPSPIAFGRIRHTDGEENLCRGWTRKRWTKHLERDICLLRSPDAPTICPLPIPKDLVDTCRNIVHRLDQRNHPEWVVLKTDLLKEHDHKCVYSGLKCDNIEPIFSFRTKSKKVHLEGFTLVHTCLRNLIYIDHARSSEKSNIEMMSHRISLVNPDISIEEAEMVYRRMVRASLNRREWRIYSGKFHFAASVCNMA